MATRATIKIEGIKYAKIYKHWDGNPESTLEFLEDFNKDFTENRGDDAQYKFAQLLRFSKQHADKYDLDNSDYTGWGVVSYFGGFNEEYEYTLLSDGRVKVQATY